MNTACVITTCATNARNVAKDDPSSFFSRDTDNLYRVNLRLYLYFDEIIIAAPVGNFYTGSIFAPVETLFVKPVTISSQVLAKLHTFSIEAKSLEDAIIYVNNHIDEFKNSIVWNSAESEIVNTYIEAIEEDYNIKLEIPSIKYRTQFIWDVDDIRGN